MENFFDEIGWSPAIGDPSLMGWLTVFAYILCACQCLRVLRFRQRIFDSPVQRQTYLWLLIALAMLLLGVNKQLDLQTFFTAALKYLAFEQGWYGDRRLYQKIFIVAIALGGLVAVAILLVLYRQVLNRHWLAITGLCALMVFVLIRASSFHNMDSFLGMRLVGIKMNWLLELSGIALVFYNATALLAQRKPLLDLGDIAAPQRSDSDNGS